MSVKIKAIFFGLKLAGIPKETRDQMWKFWMWFSGKKLVIGSILAVLVDMTQGMLVLFPMLQENIVQLGVPQATVAIVFVSLSRFFMWIGIAHKVWKKWFEDPPNDNSQP